MTLPALPEPPPQAEAPLYKPAFLIQNGRVQMNVLSDYEGLNRFESDIQALKALLRPDDSATPDTTLPPP